MLVLFIFGGEGERVLAMAHVLGNEHSPISSPRALYEHEHIRGAELSKEHERPQRGVGHRAVEGLMEDHRKKGQLVIDGLDTDV